MPHQGQTIRNPENDEDAEYIALENDALAVSQKKLLFDDAS